MALCPLLIPMDDENYAALPSLAWQWVSTVTVGYQGGPSEAGDCSHPPPMARLGYSLSVNPYPFDPKCVRPENNNCVTAYTCIYNIFQLASICVLLFFVSNWYRPILSLSTPCYTTVSKSVNQTLTLNVPVPYKYGTHQCVEPRFHALEPHLSRTSRALPTRVPRTRAAVRRRPRNSHSHASRGSAHFHAFAGRSSAHFHAIGNSSSAHFHAIRSRRSANFDGFISHAFQRIPTQW